MPVSNCDREYLLATRVTWIRDLYYGGAHSWRGPMARDLIREQTSKCISHMLEGFQKTGGTSAPVQYFALAERREVERTNPTAVTREEIEAYSNAMADNPVSTLLPETVQFRETTKVRESDKRRCFQTADSRLFIVGAAGFEPLLPPG
jgi:hypothetical protein